MTEISLSENSVRGSTVRQDEKKADHFNKYLSEQLKWPSREPDSSRGFAFDTTIVIPKSIVRENHSSDKDKRRWPITKTDSSRCTAAFSRARPKNGKLGFKFEGIDKENSWRRNNSVDSDKNRDECRNDEKNISKHPRSGVKFGNGNVLCYPNKYKEAAADSVKENDYFELIKNLATKEPDEIICVVLGENSGFGDVFNQDELKPDWLMKILQIVKKVCRSQFADETLRRFVGKFRLLYHVSYYLGGFEKNQNASITRNNMKDFIDDLVVFYSSVVDTLPDLAVEKSFATRLENMKKDVNADLFGIGIDDSITARLNVAIAKLANFEKIMAAAKARTKTSDSLPPDDFRCLSLYPTCEDLRRLTFEFVRPNKIKGAYDNVEHYLDVQFRLLREDFIDPLRTGLKKYAEAMAANEGKPRFKYDGVRLYSNTTFANAEFTLGDAVGYVLNFDPGNKLKINWEHSKKFLHGSLLLFSDDNFDTFFCGTVLERRPEQLINGRIVVSLSEFVKPDKAFYGTRFLMIECEAFYEPYKLVMKALRNFDEYNFPMRRYIVQAHSETRRPAYLYAYPNWDLFGLEVNILDDKSWPSAVQLDLDEYQHHALKSALTRDFAVIQGPPGTGKTFLGLKIMEILINNSWRFEFESPILIVCFTNHALDQFLEGILQYTSSIVRIGGQSRNEALKDFNLREQKKLRRVRDEAIRKRIKETREELRGSLREINNTMLLYNEFEKPIGILSLDLLAIDTNDSLRHPCELQNDDDLVKWLLNAPVDREEFENDDDDDDDDKILLLRDENASSFRQFHETRADENYVKIRMRKKYVPGEEEYNLIHGSSNWEDDETLDRMQGDKLYAITLRRLDRKIRINLIEYSALQRENFPSDVYFRDVYDRLDDLRRNIIAQSRMYQTLVENLKTPIFDEKSYERICASNANLRSLSTKNRWIVYWHWVRQLKVKTMAKLSVFQSDFTLAQSRCEEDKQKEDLSLIQQFQVVGMTTTGAARLNTLLNSLHPAIVIVEEAAEVLEAHVVSSITKKCRHVILIGDHKQLKPSSATYELARNYNLDVSLFERMINNGMDCPILNVQHRMRPEISALISPLIYKDLGDHSSVHHYEDIKGVEKNVFFLDHTVYEENVEEATSWKNIFEAEFVCQLARYLVLQNIDATTITILTTYTGQLFCIKDMKKRYELLRSVKVVVVDKYQGEENDIIILSLVRSNEEAKVGFLRTENRVCVALSRAKKGLYIIGNMNNLSQDSKMWKELKTTLETQDAIGKELLLCCNKHQVRTPVSKAADFDKVLEGGCDNYCGERMSCGHDCNRLCHNVDTDHVLNTTCREPCQRTCPRGHPCQLPCYRNCNDCRMPVKRKLRCNHEVELPCYEDENKHDCIEVTEVVLLCGHVAKKQCHVKLKYVECKVPCNVRLKCGHVCTGKCHKRDDPDHVKFLCKKPCEKSNKNCSREHKCSKLCSEECGDCTVNIKLALKCGHEVTVLCATDSENFKCRKICEKICADCTKQCQKFCSDDCKPCINIVEKIVPECGHVIQTQCSTILKRSSCTSKCNRILYCGHECNDICEAECRSKLCEVLVKVTNIRAPCGHYNLKMPCWKKDMTLSDEELLQYCDERCDSLLKCTHPCTGTCSECYQKRLHKVCQNKCEKILICGHGCISTCGEICTPCRNPCSFRCIHSKCPKYCGVPCVSCKEKCEWKCKHLKCRKKCGAICDREPCYEPCDKKLECGHGCIGFCGEPCPPKCRTCDLFGYEVEPDARFVYLEDCEHVIESRALERYLSVSPEGGEILTKVCPLCKSPITKTLRFMNMLKRTFKHITNVKRKIYGDKKELSQNLKKIVSTALTLLLHDKYFVTLGWSKIPTLLHEFATYCNRPTPISMRQMETINYFVEMLESIGSRLPDLIEPSAAAAATATDSPELNKIAKTVDFMVTYIDIDPKKSLKISRQLMHDLNEEIRRFHRMVDYIVVLHGEKCSIAKTLPNVVKLRNDIETILFERERYSTGKDENVKLLLDNLEKETKSNVGLALILKEKRLINLAMSKNLHDGVRTTGRWFTCSNGHYYCITECGDATRKSNCLECKEINGGAEHTT